VQLYALLSPYLKFLQVHSLKNTATVKATDTTDILQTTVIETFARCQLYRLLWP